MAFVSISGFKYLDTDGNGRRASTLIKGSNPDVVLVLDKSGSAGSNFRGSVDVGDLNLDGRSNTILDAEISSAGSLQSSLLSQGFGNSKLGLVSFDGSASTIFDGTANQKSASSTSYDFYAAARTIRLGGVTNYTDALQKAQDLLNSWGSTQGNVIFLSDGAPNRGNGVSIFNQLSAAGHNVQAFGVGNGASISSLNAIDSDGSAYIFQDPDELKAALSGQLSGGVLNSIQYTEQGMAGVQLYVDTNGNGQFDSGELTATTDQDGNYTISGVLTDGTYAVREVVPNGYRQTEIPGQIIVDGNSTSFTGVNFGNEVYTPPVTVSNPAPANAICDYLSFAPQTLPARPNDDTAKYFDYVDRYPLTLKTAFIADYNAGKAPSQALWGQQHWFNSGSKQGRVLDYTGTEDINDYGAYVENYGTTLLDIYRASPDSNPSSASFKSLYNWGKDHYNTMGKAAGREIGGGVDWGAIVKQNFDLYTKWQDAQIVDPNLSAFAYGYRNQNTIKAANGVQVGRDTQEKLTGQYVYGLGGNDVLTGTANDDLLHGGFGDDLICNGNGGTDLVYGGPGKDVFKLHSGGTLNIRDFRKGTDFIQLGDGMTDADVQLVFDGFNNSTSFKMGSETLASVYGTNPNDFSFAQVSEGLNNVFIA